LRTAAGVAVIFGLRPLYPAGGRCSEGPPRWPQQEIPSPLLWFNFLSGFVYVLARVGIARGRRWGVLLSIGLAVMIAAVFALFGLSVFQGAAFEMRTVDAMSLLDCLGCHRCGSGSAHRVTQSR